MYDFSVGLRENPDLLALLSHYAQGVTEDRTWQPRLMQMDGIDSKQLTSLHGDLIALNGIEPNAGQTILCPDGTVAACYRVTHSGLREYRRVHGIEVIEEHSETSKQSRAHRKRSKKDDSLAVAAEELRNSDHFVIPVSLPVPQ